MGCAKLHWTARQASGARPEGSYEMAELPSALRMPGWDSGLRPSSLPPCGLAEPPLRPRRAARERQPRGQA